MVFSSTDHKDHRGPQGAPLLRVMGWGITAPPQFTFIERCLHRLSRWQVRETAHNPLEVEESQLELGSLHRPT